MMPFTWDGNAKQPLSQRFVIHERGILPPVQGGGNANASNRARPGATGRVGSEKSVLQVVDGEGRSRAASGAPHTRLGRDHLPVMRSQDSREPAHLGLRGADTRLTTLSREAVAALAEPTTGAEMEGYAGPRPSTNHGDSRQAENGGSAPRPTVASVATPPDPQIAHGATRQEPEVVPSREGLASAGVPPVRDPTRPPQA